MIFGCEFIEHLLSVPIFPHIGVISRIPVNVRLFFLLVFLTDCILSLLLVDKPAQLVN